MTYRGVVRGRSIEVEDPLPFAEGQAVTLSLAPAPPGSPAGSPAAVREAMRAAPHVAWEDVDALERAIAEGRLPVRDGNVFPEES